MITPTMYMWESDEDVILEAFCAPGGGNPPGVYDDLDEVVFHREDDGRYSAVTPGLYLFAIDFHPSLRVREVEHVHCPYCCGIEADYHTACFYVEAPGCRDADPDEQVML